MPFSTPALDYHALAPEIILTGTLVFVLLLDLVVGERSKRIVTQVAGLGLILSLLPIITLALDDPESRSMFGGAFVVDEFALVLKALFLATGYIVLLMSVDYLEKGDYYKGEFSFLLLSSILGMVVISSARDLISIFVALELLSIPAYMLAGWRKHDLKSNEASLKYYLLGVLASAVMLYGMSLIFGVTGTTVLTNIDEALRGARNEFQPVVAMGIFFVIVGFAFKVSAVPFHFWAPDTYEGAPTPITAFLSVASKSAGFVALLQLVFIGFLSEPEVWAPMFWVIAALTMTVGNVVALKQTNIVRMLAYSSIAQAGYMLVPFAVAGDNLDAAKTSISAVVVYLLVYAAMNLGAFAVVMAVANKTGSGELHSYNGLFQYAPGLTLFMTAFVFSLAGIPPFGGWFAKLYIFQSVVASGTGWAIALGVITAVNSVIALFYYAGVARRMWMEPAPEGERTGIKVPASLAASLALSVGVVIVIGVLPNLFARLGEFSSLVS